jgi:hypothetical protein
VTRLRSHLVLLALLAGATSCSTGAADGRPSARPDPAGRGTVPAPPTQPGTRFVALSSGESQKISGATPVFPGELRILGVVYTVLVKICISRAGSVDSVSPPPVGAPRPLPRPPRDLLGGRRQRRPWSIRRRRRCCRVVPEGEALVATSADLSFDSRYFGAVPLAALSVARPLLTF